MLVEVVSCFAYHLLIVNNVDNNFIEKFRIFNLV